MSILEKLKTWWASTKHRRTTKVERVAILSSWLLFSLTFGFADTKLALFMCFISLGIFSKLNKKGYGLE